MPVNTQCASPHASTPTTCDDGPYDDEYSAGADEIAHGLLRMVGERPGQMGRLRAARVIGGWSVPTRDDDEAAALATYMMVIDWPLKEVVALVDALIGGGLIAQTSGPRPVLVLTRAGHRALDALQQGGT